MQSKYVVKYGHQGDLVLLIQDLLGLIKDGKFDHKTKTAVEHFQRRHDLVPDGVVGPMTWLVLGHNPLEIEADTEVITSATWIEQYNLPEGEYVKNQTSKKWIILHHTSGLHNPYKVIDEWAKDQRGRVGTHYVIGGLPASANVYNLSKVQSQYDGKILQAIPDQYWAYSLGNIKSSLFHSKSLNIELCSAGKLIEKNGEYFTWYGAKVHSSQVVRLETPFKDHRYFHKYSKEQLDSLKALLLLLKEKHDIDLSKCLLEDLKTFNVLSFDYRPNYNHNSHPSGLMTHAQLKEDKFDLFPQPELVDMLLKLS